MESITIRLEEYDKLIIKTVSKLLGVTQSGFIKMKVLDSAREFLLKNNLDPDNLNQPLDTSENTTA